MKTGAKTIILYTRGESEDEDPEILEFLRYIENSTEAFASASKDSLVKMAHEKVGRVKERKRDEYMTLQEYLEAEIYDGIQEAMQEIKEGKIPEVVKRVEQKRIAKSLKDNGVSIELIAESTGLKVEEIEEL